MKFLLESTQRNKVEDEAGASESKQEVGVEFAPRSHRIVGDELLARHSMPPCDDGLDLPCRLRGAKGFGFVGSRERSDPPLRFRLRR
ncbi:MAG: hypothetical protein ACI8V5_004682, partial [Limisphaerales bacterium]